MSVALPVALSLTICYSLFDYRQRKLNEVTSDRDRFRQQLDLVHNDKQNLDKMRSSLATQVDDLASEIEKLKLANADLHRSRDHLEDEKDDSGITSYYLRHYLLT